MHFAIQAPGDGGQKPGVGLNPFFARIHQHKTARTVSIFGCTGLKTALAEEGSLLIARDAPDGNFSTE